MCPKNFSSLYAKLPGHITLQGLDRRTWNLCLAHLQFMVMTYSKFQTNRSINVEEVHSTNFTAPKILLSTICLSSRAHNSARPGPPNIKFMSCTSTIHGDDIFQVSSQSLKKCGSSSLHKLVTYYVDRPTDRRPTDRVTPLYPLQTSFGGYNN